MDDQNSFFETAPQWLINFRDSMCALNDVIYFNMFNGFPEILADHINNLTSVLVISNTNGMFITLHECPFKSYECSCNVIKTLSRYCKPIMMSECNTFLASLFVYIVQNIGQYHLHTLRIGNVMQNNDEEPLTFGDDNTILRILHDSNHHTCTINS